MILAHNRPQPNEVQNWKITREIMADLTNRKNRYLINFRVMRNLSQEKAAIMAGISTATWAGLENKKMNPTIHEAEKVSSVIGKLAGRIFPIILDDMKRNIAIRTFSKLGLYRVMKGQSQSVLSSLSDVSIYTISKLEREWMAGEEIPRDHLMDVQRLADFIGCDIVDIIGQIDIDEEETNE